MDPQCNGLPPEVLREYSMWCTPDMEPMVFYIMGFVAIMFYIIAGLLMRNFGVILVKWDVAFKAWLMKKDAEVSEC